MNEKAEYANDFLYFSVRPYADIGRNSVLYCAGVNLTRFLSITKGKHGLASNPAMRGLQLVRHGISDLAIAKGAVPTAIRRNECLGLVRSPDMWYTDRLLVSGAAGNLAAEMMEFGVRTFLKKLFNACRIDFSLPPELPQPEQLQVMLEEVCRAQEK